MSLIKSKIIPLFICMVIACETIECNLQTELTSKLLNALSPDNLSNVIRKARSSYESQKRANSWQSRTQTSLKDGYDDQICYEQLEALREGLNRSEVWAYRVADSWGKLPSGILSGNIIELGNYDQCLAIQKQLETNTTFEGQYCLSYVTAQVNESNIPEDAKPFPKRYNFEPTNIRMLPITPSSEEMELTLSFGICSPATCSEEVLIELIRSSLDEVDVKNVTVRMVPHTCQKQEDTDYRPEDIAVFSFFGLITFVMTASTLYDVIRTSQGKNKIQGLIAFSMYTNGQKLFSCKRTRSSDVMECLNGIRVLSTFWVLYGHSHTMFVAAPVTNLLIVKSWVEHVYSMFALSAPIAVDSFFFMSGLLVAWYILREFEKSNGRLNYAFLYFHRYLRLTPLLAVCVVVSMTIFKHFGSGPLWPFYNALVVEGTCRKYWWSTLLYIQNYYNVEDLCLGHTWYLSVDMQLFILSPPVIYLLWRYTYKVAALLVIITLGVIGLTVFLYVEHGFSGRWLDLETLMQHMDRMQITYFPTHVRMGAWIVGILVGYALHQIRGRRVIISKTILSLGWLASLAMVFGVVFGNYPLQQLDNDSTPLIGGLYHGFTRVTWCMALGWIVFACHWGYGGPINWFLSLAIWQPFARLTYAIYLLHLCVMLYVTGQCRTSNSFSQLNVLHKMMGDVFFTVILATLATLAFESPIVVLEKIFLKKNHVENKKEGDLTVVARSHEELIENEENGRVIESKSNVSHVS